MMLNGAAETCKHCPMCCVQKANGNHRGFHCDSRTIITATPSQHFKFTEIASTAAARQPWPPCHVQQWPELRAPWHRHPLRQRQANGRLQASVSVTIASTATASAGPASVTAAALTANPRRQRQSGRERQQGNSMSDIKHGSGSGSSDTSQIDIENASEASASTFGINVIERRGCGRILCGSPTSL